MNLRVVNKGSLNNLVAEPDLVGDIKTIQRFDDEVEKIKSYLSKGNSSFLTVDDDGTLFFRGRLVVPRKQNLDSRSDVMREANTSRKQGISPGS